MKTYQLETILPGGLQPLKRTATSQLRHRGGRPAAGQRSLSPRLVPSFGAAVGCLGNGWMDGFGDFCRLSVTFWKMNPEILQVWLSLTLLRPFSVLISMAKKGRLHMYIYIYCMRICKITHFWIMNTSLRIQPDSPQALGVWPCPRRIARTWRTLTASRCLCQFWSSDPLRFELWRCL